MLHVIKPSEIESVVGKEVGTSDWITIDQERIDKFADATLDNQFIHVNPEQAEPIFGSTIAHGFLSLSLVAGIPFSQGMGLVLEGTKMGLNYGLDKVRFLSPVPVNSEVRIIMKCLDILIDKCVNAYDCDIKPHILVFDNTTENSSIVYDSYSELYKDKKILVKKILDYNVKYCN